MSTTWYAKIDCNFHSNRKNRKAGRLGREVFLFVLCINAQKGALGEIAEKDIELEYLAEQLQMSLDEAREGIAKCVAADLMSIENGIVRINGWNDDYAKYPMSNAERQQRLRDRNKAKKAPNDATHTVSDAANSNDRNGDSVTASVTHNEESRPVTQVGRKVGREGESARFDPSDSGQTGSLARQTWARLSEIRIALAREIGLPGVLPLTAITPASSNQPGFRNLVARIHDEGPDAPAVCARVLEVLTTQARDKHSIEWLSEKAFSEGAWRHAREQVPKWRKPELEREAQTWLVDGEEVSA